VVGQRPTTAETAEGMILCHGK